MFKPYTHLYRAETSLSQLLSMLDEYYDSTLQKLFPNKPYNQFWESFDKQQEYVQTHPNFKDEDVPNTVDINVTEDEHQQVMEALEKDKYFIDYLTCETLFALAGILQDYMNKYGELD